MVVGYDCPRCGFKHDCDVDQSGERICPDCGDIAVTGITSRDTRGVGMNGDEPFVVTISGVGKRDRHVTVSAHGYESAYNAAKGSAGEDDYITDISTKQAVAP